MMEALLVVCALLAAANLALAAAGLALLLGRRRPAETEERRGDPLDEGFENLMRYEADALFRGDGA